MTVTEQSVFDTSFETILVTRAERVATVTLNRPRALNALNTTVMREVVAAVQALDLTAEIGAIVLTGSEKAFAAGADIKEMAGKTYPEILAEDLFHEWDGFTRVRTPVIAAVAGYALGGGCELAMMADFIIAAENAKFGQPEITLGIIPGMGGSQRLTRAIGKAKAMDLVLTGRHIGAEEAERSGLVARVVPTDKLQEEAAAAAAKIAGLSTVAVSVAKEAVNRAFESTLAEGLHYERRVFHALFATPDQKEGMAAFTEKREANWQR